MKKLLLFLILFLFVPSVYAYSYGIENFYINATLDEHGDLIVEEYFNLNGEFNGFERIIKYKNATAPTFYEKASSFGGSTIHNGSGLQILQVASVDIDDNYNFDNQFSKVFKLASSAKKGDYGVYTVNTLRDGKSLLIYLPSKKHKAFYIKYKIEDMGILHNDIGELGWNVFGQELNESVNHLKLNLTVKNNKDLIKVWGHGPLNGNVKITSSNSIMLTINDLSSYTAVDVRLAFDRDAISLSNKETNVDALDRIIIYENRLAEEANKERREHDAYMNRDINSMIKKLKANPSREYYNTVLQEIYSLYDENEISKQLLKLEELQPIIDQAEYNQFKEILNSKTSPKYQDYQKAMKFCNNVFDTELQKKMISDIKTIKRRVIVLELKNELTISEIILLMIMVSYGYKKLLKRLSLRKKYYNKINYIRELPSDLSPAAAGLLIDNRLSKDEIAATLLDLIRKKVIVFNKKDNGSYDLSYLSTYEVSQMGVKLSKIESSLIRFIFRKDKAINTKKMPKFDSDSYDEWKNEVLNELEDKSLIEKYRDVVEVNIIQILLGFLMILFGFIRFNNMFFSTFNIFFFVGILLVCNYLYKRYQERFIIWFNFPVLIYLIGYGLFKSHYIHFSIIFAVLGFIMARKILFMVPNKMKLKKTKLGKQEMVKWNAFKSFLLDFSKIDLREINEIVLWEDYLIYATALGISKNVIDKMKMKIEGLNIDSEMFTDYVIFSSMSDIDVISDFFNYYSSLLSRASIPVISIPESSGFSGSSDGWSSGSGGGGGFSGGSSGGGSFGGGGGGGRF